MKYEDLIIKQIRRINNEKIKGCIEVKDQGDFIITSVSDTALHHYHNENDECVYRTVCKKKIRSEILNSNFLR